jgi:hypothetical protein
MWGDSILVIGSLTSLLRVGAGVTTPLGLLGLVAAAALVAYVRKLRSQRHTLESVAESERGKIADTFLTRYGINAKGLSAVDRVRLIRSELRTRFIAGVSLTLICVAAFVTCFSMALHTLTSGPTRDGGGDGAANQSSSQISSKQILPGPIPAVGFAAFDVYPIKPAFGTKFDIFPRVVDFEWHAVPGAENYSVEIENQKFDMEWGENIAGGPFAAPRIVMGEKFQFSCPGMGLYRWRVTAINKDGIASHPSVWQVFQCLR